jgi:CubicO group peptidase (beta-lactamase class C family)
MRIAKRLLALVLLIAVWAGVVLFGAINGWWLKPIAPAGNADDFWRAAVAITDAHRPANIALALVRSGEVPKEHYAAASSVDHIDRETVFPMASTSKWISAYGVMQLVQAGKIDLDAPVSRYLKRWQLPKSNFDLDGVTVRRLLSHTAGLTDELGFGDYRAEESIPSLEASLRHPRASSGNKVIAVGSEPGSSWQYSGGGYLILQLIVEDVSGQSFAQWTQQAVFDPIGMQRASYSYIGTRDNAARSYDANGKFAPSYQYAAAAATGLSASISDLLKFVQANVRAEGLGQKVLTPVNVDAMRTPLGRQFGADIWGLGLMLYAPTARKDYVYGHDGANDPAINTAVRINPDNGDAIIVLVSGNPKLATLIGYEWTLWQTGKPDFLLIDKVIDSAVNPFLFGLLGIVLMFVLWVIKRRGKPASR